MFSWCTQHGIGVPSVIVILHEILKLLHYAEAQDVKFFRIGTSGGLGINKQFIVSSVFVYKLVWSDISDYVELWAFV